MFSNKRRGSNNDAAAAAQISHFDHNYNARIIAYSPSTFCPAPLPSAHSDNDPKLPPGRVAELTLSGDGIVCRERVGERIGEMRERVVKELKWGEIGEIAWDHQQSQVRFTSVPPPQSPRNASNDSAPPPPPKKQFIIFLVGNSIELEGNVKLRLKGLSRKMGGTMRLPQSLYIGMFAGVTKPKPFQRKRASLTTDTSEQLPPLEAMRSWAIDSYQGSGRPLPTALSARRAIAIQHIYEGLVTFRIRAARGQGIEQPYGDGAALCFGENGLTYYIDYPGDGSRGEVGLKLDYGEVESWEVRDSREAASQSCFIVVQKGTSLQFSFYLRNDDYGPTLLHLRHALEFFWNQRLELDGKPSLPFTTYGRSIARIFSLQGHKDPPPVPLGSLDVMTSEGAYVGGSSDGQRNRRSSSVLTASSGAAGQVVNTGSPKVGSGKFEAIRRNTSTSAGKRGSFFGGNKAKSIERDNAREVWQYVVKHQGWLVKKGGVGPTGKKLLNRYFVLYSTCMGHFLSYYADYGESPLFSNARKERNLIDLAKVTFIRPVSNQPDAPPFSFDVVTIEREWTLSAPNEDSMQLWLQLLTTAVDEDVAIVPDDELNFEVKTIRDPTDRLMKYDYSTLIKVSANGVSVGTKNGKSEYYERFFWCYTDFYKWSVQNQFGKLTLFCSVFSNTEFSQQSKQEMEFRTRQAVQLASAIEFYIEKFMSIMYLKNEGKGEEEGGEIQHAEDFGEDDYEAEEFGGSGGEEADHDGGVSRSVDLLSLDDSGGVPTAQAVAASPSSLNAGIPIARTSLTSEPLALPPPPPSTQQQNPSVFDPFGENNNVNGSNTAATSATFDDVFGNDDPAPAPTPSKTSMPAEASDDLFSAFNTDTIQPPITQPYATQGPSATALQQMESTNIPAFLSGKKEGMLIQSGGVMNVMLKQEWRGSQGRISVCYVNASEGEIADLNAEVKPTDPNNQSLRIVLNAASSNNISKGTQIVQQCMIECMQPFDCLPDFNLTFKVGDQPYEFKLKLPICITHFVESVNMVGNDFMARWGKLNGEAQQKQLVLQAKKPTTPSFVSQLFNDSKMFVLPDLSNDSSVCAVGTLRTGSVSAKGDKICVGILARVEINNGAQAYRLTVRTAHAQVSKYVHDQFARRLVG